MAPKPGIIGINDMMRNLNQKLVEYQISGTKGMRKAAGFIRGEMEHVSPKVPVDEGHLRASWFIETMMMGKNRSGIKFGFSANYAVYVHEMVGGNKDINWSRPGSGAKFMEAAIKRNPYKILLIIRDQMTIGGTLK